MPTLAWWSSKIFSFKFIWFFFVEISMNINLVYTRCQPGLNFDLFICLFRECVCLLNFANRNFVKQHTSVVWAVIVAIVYFILSIEKKTQIHWMKSSIAQSFWKYLPVKWFQTIFEQCTLKCAQILYNGSISAVFIFAYDSYAIHRDAFPIDRNSFFSSINKTRMIIKSLFLMRHLIR